MDDWQTRASRRHASAIATPMVTSSGTVAIYCLRRLWRLGCSVRIDTPPEIVVVELRRSCCLNSAVQIPDQPPRSGAG
jgi:hypothetical protein